jgi:hypothetical protein
MRGSSCPGLDQKTPGAEQMFVTTLMNRGIMHGMVYRRQKRAFFDIMSVDRNYDAGILKQEFRNDRISQQK